MSLFLEIYRTERLTLCMLGNYPSTKSEGYSFGVVRPSVHPEPYLSTYLSDLIHSWYKLISTMDSGYSISLVKIDPHNI